MSTHRALGGEDREAHGRWRSAPSSDNIRRPVGASRFDYQVLQFALAAARDIPSLTD